MKIIKLASLFFGLTAVLLLPGCSTMGAMDLYKEYKDQVGASAIVIEGRALLYGGGSIISAYASKECKCTVKASKNDGIEITPLEQ